MPIISQLRYPSVFLIRLVRASPLDEGSGVIPEVRCSGWREKESRSLWLGPDKLRLEWMGGLEKKPELVRAEVKTQEAEAMKQSKWRE